MSTEKIITMLDRVASDLEGKGLLKEAEMLDVVANTLERIAYTPGATRIKLLDDAIKSAEEAERLVKEDHTRHGFTQEAFDKLLDPVSRAVSELFKEFEGLHNVHFGDKGEHERYPLEVHALDVGPEQSSDSAKTMLGSLLSELSKVEKFLNKFRDPGDISKLVKSLKHIKSEWARAVPIISRAQ